MKIEIEAEPKEIAVLVAELQGQQKCKCKEVRATIGRVAQDRPDFSTPETCRTELNAICTSLRIGKAV